MGILLDNQPVAPTSSQTVAQFLEDVKHRLRGSGNIILSLRRDGADVTADELSTILSRPMAQFDDLRFETGPAGALVGEALEQARKSLASSYAEAKLSAERLAGGDLAGAMNKLLECIRTWAQIHETITAGGGLLGIDFDNLEMNGQPVTAIMRTLAERLSGLRDAIESRDHVRLVDLLQYELDEMLAGWEGLLEKLASRV